MTLQTRNSITWITLMASLSFKLRPSLVVLAWTAVDTAKPEKAICWLAISPLTIIYTRRPGTHWYNWKACLWKKYRIELLTVQNNCFHLHITGWYVSEILFCLHFFKEFELIFHMRVLLCRKIGQIFWWTRKQKRLCKNDRPLTLNFHRSWCYIRCLLYQ